MSVFFKKGEHVFEIFHTHAIDYMIVFPALLQAENIRIVIGLNPFDSLKKIGGLPLPDYPMVIIDKKSVK